MTVKSSVYHSWLKIQRYNDIMTLEINTVHSSTVSIIKCRCLEAKISNKSFQKDLINTALDMPAKPSGGITKIVCSQCIKRQ